MKKNNKEIKSLKILKKGFVKNEIVIYAIALMLVTAGYFNYTSNLNFETVETYSENIEEKEDIEENEISSVENEVDEKRNDEDIGDAKLVNSNDIINEENNSNEESNNNENNSGKESNNNQNGDSNKEDNNNENNNRSEENNGKENSIESEENNDENYFASSKLQRDTNYADMITTYTKILEDSSVSETQKAIAMTEITKINNIKNSILVCENILSTKEFKNYLILVNEESVNVVVQVDGDLTTEKVAQIQNIVSRELKSEIENIHICQWGSELSQ